MDLSLNPHSAIVTVGTNCLTLPRLSFLICKMGIMVTVSQGRGKDSVGECTGSFKHNARYAVSAHQMVDVKRGFGNFEKTQYTGLPHFPPPLLLSGLLAVNPLPSLQTAPGLAGEEQEWESTTLCLGGFMVRENKSISCIFFTTFLLRG